MATRRAPPAVWGATMSLKKLAAGLLIDATIVRALLVPALVSIFERHA